MRKVRTHRLRKLANHLLHGQLGHTFFDFRTYNCGDEDENGCGTLGCAIGECPILFPNEWKFDKQGEPVIVYKEIRRTKHSAMDFFNMCLEEYDELFVPGTFPKVTDIYLNGDATKEQVANRILKFCDIKEKEQENE